MTSIVLPCYNPLIGWEQIIFTNYDSFCNKIAAPIELILVLDGVSTSITKEAINFLKYKIPSIKIIQYQVNRGKGYAIRQGVKEATGDIIIYTDADFPYTEDSLYTVYNKLKSKECDIAIGIKNEQYYDQVPVFRKTISRCLRFFTRVLLSIPITDTQCGLKGFNDSAKSLFLQTTIDRYLFDLEFIRNCFKSKRYIVKTIPISLKENIHFRKMNYHVLISESVNFIMLLVRK